MIGNYSLLKIGIILQAKCLQKVIINSEKGEKGKEHPPDLHTN